MGRKKFEESKYVWERRRGSLTLKNSCGCMLSLLRWVGKRKARKEDPICQVKQIFSLLSLF